MDTFANRVDFAIETLFASSEFTPSRYQVEEALKPIIDDLTNLGYDAAVAYVRQTYDDRKNYHRLCAVLYRKLVTGQEWN